MSDDLRAIAELLGRRNDLDAAIAQHIGRPMTSGHLGEWIASRVFDIELEPSASAVAIDGRFRSGPLAGRTVNIKWYLRREGLLDMTSSDLLDYYLVLAGPASTAASSSSGVRPWVIASVHLFDARSLRNDLLARGRKVGVASSVRVETWRQAEVYPATNASLALTNQQRAVLELFAPEALTKPRTPST